LNAGAASIGENGTVAGDTVAGDWAHYWRAADEPLEAMHAHFERHVYHRHSHETYSLGVTDVGAQSFSCRGAAYTSAAGMVMAFNPDDPHDGQATDGFGFTYRMIHIGPELVASVLADAADGPVGLPLFAEPVLSDPVLAARLRRLHRALLGDATALRRDELLAGVVLAAARRSRRAPPRSPSRLAQLPAEAESAHSGSAHPGPAHAGPGDGGPADARRVAGRARDLIAGRYRDDLTAGDLATATGRSRFAVHRAFTHVYGMPPSDYQRQLRLREARALIAAGTPISEAAVLAGFADQSHLSRWFVRYYGVTPGRYQRATALAPAPAMVLDP
jgi:AraC-like DNA-binding protein